MTGTGFLTSDARDENFPWERVRVIQLMVLGLLADLVIILHALFVLFVAAGGFLVMAWRGKVALVHAPAVLWAVTVQWAGWICPLTPLENKLRSMAGMQVYKGDFLEHYLIPILYPEILTRDLQMGLGAGVLVVNVMLYWLAFKGAGKRPRD